MEPPLQWDGIKASTLRQRWRQVNPRPTCTAGRELALGIRPTIRRKDAEAGWFGKACAARSREREVRGKHLSPLKVTVGAVRPQ